MQTTQKGKIYFKHYGRSWTFFLSFFHATVEVLRSNWVHRLARGSERKGGAGPLLSGTLSGVWPQFHQHVLDTGEWLEHFTAGRGFYQSSDFNFPPCAANYIAFQMQLCFNSVIPVSPTFIKGHFWMETWSKKRRKTLIEWIFFTSSSVLEQTLLIIDGIQ